MGGRWRGWLVIGAVGALFLAGCGSDGDDGNTSPTVPEEESTEDDDAPDESDQTTDPDTGGDGGDPDDEGTDSEDEATDETVAGDALDLDLPRSITYGAMSLEVTDVVSSDEHPTAPDSSEEGMAYVGLTFTATNELDDANLTLPPGTMLLEADGERSEVGFNEANTIAVDAGNDAEEEVWFAIEDDVDLSAPELVIGETDFQPARLPLTGDEAVTRVDITTPSETLGDDAQSLTLEPEGWIEFNRAILDGDLGPNVDSSSIGRAPDGFAYLHIPGGGSDQGSGRWALADGYDIESTLSVDGRPTSGASTWYDWVDDAYVEGVLTVLVPLDSETVTVVLDYELGEGEPANATFEIDVSAMADLTV